MLEKRDDRPGERIILVARHHVRGTSDVGELRAGDLREKLLHTSSVTTSELASHEQRGDVDVPHGRLEERLETY